MKNSDWIAYWNSAAKKNNNNIVFQNGYQGKLSFMPDSSLELLVKSIVRYLDLDKNDLLLDVGCGSGMLTIPLADYVEKIVGVDAAEQMILKMPKTIKSHLAKADNLPFEKNSFDKLLCHSIFQYFPDIKYSEMVISEMKRIVKPNGRIYIVDVPDKSKMEDYNKNKKEEDHDLSRIFYDKMFFLEMLREAITFDNELEGYGNSKYRFNVLFNNLK